MRKLLGLLVVSFLVLGCEPSAGEWVGKGRSAFDRGLFDESLEHYQKALSIDPNRIDAVMGMADVYLKQGKYEEALKHLSGALETFQQAGVRKELNEKLGDAYLLKAEQVWRAGKYRQSPEVEVEIEEAALEATKLGVSNTKNKAFALLTSLYDYQFENLRGQYAGLSAEEASALQEKELAHVDKVFRTIRPSPEFRKRMRDRVKELTQEAFYRRASQSFAERVRPALEVDPNVTADEEKLRVITRIPAGEELLAEGLTPDERHRLMQPYLQLSKRQTLEVSGIVIAGMLGIDRMRRSIRPESVMSFLVERDELTVNPEDNAPLVLVEASISLKELFDLAFDYQLYLETEAKSEETPQEGGAGSAVTGDAEGAGASPAGEAAEEASQP